MSQHIHKWLDLLVASTENKWPKMCGPQKRQRNIGYYLLALVGTNQLEFKSKSILGKPGDVQSQGMPGNGTLRQMIQKWIVGCNWGMFHCRGRLTKGRPPRNEHRIHATSASTVLHLAQVASNYSQSDKFKDYENMSHTFALCFV